MPSKKEIVVCAGHYQKSKGARNKYLGISEWQINYAIASSLYIKLTDYDYETYACLDDTLIDKVKLINAINPILALDIHLNAYDEKQVGHLCMHYYSSEMGRILASNINNSLSHNHTRILLQVTSVREKGGYFLCKTVCPAVIVELGYIDNIGDLTLCMTSIETIISDIIQGIKQTFKLGVL